MTTPRAAPGDFAYIGPPDPIEWRQPELGMRTDGVRCAINVPTGHMYDRRIVGEPHLDGSGVLWVTFAHEQIWYQALAQGRDTRSWASYAPAHVVWIEWRTIHDE